MALVWNNVALFGLNTGSKLMFPNRLLTSSWMSNVRRPPSGICFFSDRSKRVKSGAVRKIASGSPQSPGRTRTQPAELAGRM